MIRLNFKKAISQILILIYIISIFITNSSISFAEELSIEPVASTNISVSTISTNTDAANVPVTSTLTDTISEPTSSTVTDVTSEPTTSTTTDISSESTISTTSTVADTTSSAIDTTASPDASTMNITTDIISAPIVPTNITATSTADTITVTWDEVADTTGYDIEIDGTVVDNGNSTTYVHSGLTANTTHNYRVRAKNTVGNGDWSAVVSQTILQQTLSVPALPSNINATAAETSITVTWNAVTDATGYDVEADGTVVDNGNSTTYVNSGLTANTTHNYRVRAKNAVGNGDWSTVVNKTTSSPTYVSGTISQDTIWTLVNSPYILDSLTVAQGVTLTIEPGVIIKGTYHYYGITVNGKLNAVGASTAPIVFTTVKDSAYGGSGITTYSDYWGGITVGSTGEFVGDYTKIRYGYNGIYNQGKLTLTNSEVSNSYYEGIFINESISNSNITIQNSKIENSGGNGINFNQYGTGPVSITGNNIINNGNYPMYAKLYYLGTSIFDNISNNTFTGNKADGIALEGNLNINSTLSRNTYILPDNIIISNGVTATIQPGAIIRGTNNYSGITVNGKINAVGTSAEPIVFTSIKDPTYGGSGVTTYGDYWAGINVSDTGEFAGDNTKTRYGINSIYNQGKLTLTNSEVSNSYGAGICSYTTIQPTIIANSFINNAQYAIYNANPSTPVDARYNYWGSLDGPSRYVLVNDANGNPWYYDWEQNGDRISDGVDYDTWLGKEYKVQIQFGREYTQGITGNYARNFTDLDNADIKITRSYNSKDDRTNSPLGRGWTFGYEGSIKDMSYGAIGKIVKLPNGSIEVFDKYANEEYTSTYNRNTLKQVDSTFVLTTKDQSRYGFNVSGYLAWIKDRNNNTTTINVDANGRVNGITDYTGRNYTVVYNGDGLISSVTDPLNRTVQYQYTNGLLTAVIDPMGYTTSYAYDENGFLNTITDKTLKLQESINYNHQDGENKDKINYTTDANGNTFTYAYDNTNKKSTITDSNGRTKIQLYDGDYNIILSQDEEGKLTNTEYSTNNNENKCGEEGSITDRNGNKTQYTRDERGNVLTITNPNYSTKQYSYDDKNNLRSEKDELGKVTYYVYDANGINLNKKIQPLDGATTVENCNDTNSAITTFTYYDASECNGICGKIETITDPEGRSTTYAYDQYGNVATVTDGESKITQYHYNIIGLKEYEISPLGYKTEYIYDQNGNVEKAIKSDTNDASKSSIIRTVCDAEGRKVQEISPNLYDETKDDIANHVYNDNIGDRYTYNEKGQLVSKADSLGNITSYTYDLYSNVLTETKPNNSINVYEYDIMNRVTKVYLKEDANAEPVLLEEYIYTILSDKNTQKTHRVHLNDTETAVTVYTYDYANRLISQQNPDNTTTSTSYNTNGTVNTTTDANGNVAYYNYDGLNRLITKWTPFENGLYTYYGVEYDKSGNKLSENIGKDKVSLNTLPSQLISTIYIYNNNNKVTSVETAGRTTTYTYDNNGVVSKAEAKVDETNTNVTEYANNYLGKVVQKKVHVKAGDIYSNDFNSTQDVVLVTTYEYDKNGNLVTQTNPQPNGVTTTYTYDNLNRQKSVSQPGQDENGQAVTITNSVEYDFEGNKLSTTDGNDNTTNYSYNKRGQIEKVTDAKGNITLYSYDTAGRKTAEVSANNYDSTKALNEMNRTEYFYDLINRVKTVAEVTFDTALIDWVTVVTKAYKYDNNGNVLKELDALGYKSVSGSTVDNIINSGYAAEYTYNNANKLITVLDPATKDKGLSYTTSYGYDALGRKISETNAKGVVTAYLYDDLGNVLQISVNNQVMQTNTYDLIGNLTSKTDGNNITTTFEYNAFNKVRSAVYPGDNTIPSNNVTYQYDVVGNLKKQQESTGTVDLYTYDNQNRILSQIEQKADGTEAITTSVKYDKNGNKRFVTDGNGVITTNTYDELNRLKTTTITVSGIAQTTTYDYDANGNQTAQADWRGNIYTNVYDSLNRLIEKKDPDQNIVQSLEYNENNVQTKSTDALGNETQYTYDKNDRLLSTTDPENHTTSQTYDEVGNIKTKVDGNNNTTTFNYDAFNRLTSVVNAKNETTSYTYDNNNNMLTQTDGKGNITTFEYNVANKATKKIDQGGVGVPAKTESYTYYANGLLNTKVDRNGQITTYTYDSHGRMLSQTVGTTTIAYTYDNNGNQLTVTDATGATLRTYDELNRVILKTVPTIGTSTYTYDIISGMQDGFVSETAADPKGNMTTKVYDKEGRVAQVIADNQATNYTYYANGSKQSVVYPDGTSEEYTYYTDNLLSTLTNKKADNTVIDSYSYTYDGAHNQISKVDSKGTTSYTYDVLNRLLSVTEPSGKVTSYTFDAAGNRLSETVVDGTNTTVTNYTYNEQNRLTNTATILNYVTVQTVDYVYDNNGNVLTETKTPYVEGAAQTTQVTTNTYDLLNQLIQTLTPESKIVANTYNGEGLRVTKTVDGATTNYLYEFDKVVLETDGSGAQKARNVYGTNLISRNVDGQTAFYLYNGHADVVALVDGSGNNLATYYYDAFGNITEQTGIIDNNITYAGYQYDKETGKYYLNARMYDPVTARFMQEDTYRGSVNDPLSLNLYTYCSNNPLMYTDPTGHFGEGLWDATKKGYGVIKGATVKGIDRVGEYFNDPNELKKDVAKVGNTAEQLWNNPADTLTELDNKYADPVAKKILGNNTIGYNVYNYAKNRDLATMSNIIGAAKGIKTFVDYAPGPANKQTYAMLDDVRLQIGHSVGLINDNSYNTQMQANNKTLVDAMNFQMNFVPNLVKGIGHDVTTALNPVNSFNFAFNPNETVGDLADYQMSAVNTAAWAIPAAKAGMAERATFGEASVIEGPVRTEKVLIDSRKFSDYIFKEDATHGKNTVFENLGYSKTNTNELVEIYQEQAAQKYVNGQYTLNKNTEYGQKINIEIELPGIGNSIGNTSYLKSGWMVKPNGSISLNTPFAGFTRKNGGVR